MLVSFKILKYHFFVNSFIPYITTPAGVIRYGLTPDQVTALNDFLTDWNLKFKKYIDPLTNGTISRDAINTAYKAGYVLTQSIRKQVKGNTTITLSSEEKAIFNIKNPDTTKTPAGIPKTAPAFACIGQSSLSLFFIGVNPEVPFQRGKEPGIDAIGIKTAITAAGAPPPSSSDYTRLANETETEFELLFTSADVGKTLYMIGFYINTRGESGKDGIPFIITII